MAQARAGYATYGMGSGDGRAAAPKRLDEGWLTLLLHLVVIAVTAAAVARVDGRDQGALLIPMAAGGLLLGALLARSRVQDTTAHLAAFTTGVVTALVGGTVRAEGVHAIWDARGRNLFDIGHRLVSAFSAEKGATISSDDLAVLIGLTLWLVGYSSGWMLHRRHWLFPALLLPAVIALVGLRFDERTPSPLIAMFGAAALVMVARHHAFLRQAEWARLRVPAPGGVAARFAASGTVVAALALLLGWSLSFQLPSSVTTGVLDEVQQRWEQATEALDSLGVPRDRASGSSYGAFSDSFEIGPEFHPSADPVAALEALDPSYLAVRRYDAYDGHGWASDVDATFRMKDDAPDVPATSVTFAPNQPVPLTDEVSGDRENRAGVITVYRSKDGLIFTTDTFVSVTERSVAIIGWRQLGQVEISVDRADVASLPVDLQGLVRSLQGAHVVAGEPGAEPRIVDPELADQVAAERRRLASYPVNIELGLDPDGGLTLVYSGRVPNYDDVEAVLSGAGASGGPDRYRVIGAASLADEDALRAAGTQYPGWVTKRYLQLPTTVTQETIDLSRQIVQEAGASNAFDEAWAIQEYLQTNYEYELNPGATPADRDAVDYFLFTLRKGRCEHYASAMVVMLRTLGIPARLVAGYHASDERDPSGEFLYREEQAHTWVEAFFPGYGWIPFEPTQGRAPFDYDGRQRPDSPTDQAPTPPAPEPTPTPTPAPTAEATPAPLPPVDKTDGSASGSSGTNWPALAGALLAGALVLGAGLFALAWGLSLRGFRPAAALYQRVIRIGRLWGIDPNPTMTPAEYASEWSRAVPRASGAVQLVTDLYATERYGGIEVTEDVDRSGGAAWREVRGAVARWRPWRRHHRS